jgi:hypothetical protein
MSEEDYTAAPPYTFTAYTRITVLLIQEENRNFDAFQVPR